MIEGLTDFTGVSIGVLIVAFTGVMLGSAVQRLSGQGFGLISAPVVALVAPQFLPAAVLLLGFVSGIGASALDFRHVALKELPWGFAGRALGALGAAMVASQLPFERISVLVAIIVLLAVGLSLWGLSVRITRSSLFGAGIAAGLMGTLTAIGAPPMAMLYQNQEPKRSRAMQSTFFVFGMFVSIGALALHGLIEATHLRFALSLLPAILLGLILSQPLEARFSKDMVRPIALAFSSLAALLLLSKAAFS